MNLLGFHPFGMQCMMVQKSLTVRHTQILLAEHEKSWGFHIGCILDGRTASHGV